MPVVDIYSKRQKKQQGEAPDVYVYDEMPQPLRVQMVHIWRDTIEKEKHMYDRGYPYLGYRHAVKALCREYGVFTLSERYAKSHGQQYREELVDFLLKEEDIYKCLDVVEVSFKYIDKEL